MGYVNEERKGSWSYAGKVQTWYETILPVTHNAGFPRGVDQNKVTRRRRGTSH